MPCTKSKPPNLRVEDPDKTSLRLWLMHGCGSQQIVAIVPIHYFQQSWFQSLNCVNVVDIQHRLPLGVAITLETFLSYAADLRDIDIGIAIKLRYGRMKTSSCVVQSGRTEFPRGLGSKFRIAMFVRVRGLAFTLFPG